MPGLLRRRRQGLLTSVPVMPVPAIAGMLAADLTVSGLDAATFTRSTTKVFTDYEGVLRTAAINEPAFEDGRRVENLCLNSEPTDGWVAAGTTPPTVSYETHLGLAAVRIDFTQAMTAGWAGCRASGDTILSRFSLIKGHSYVGSYKVHLSRPLVGNEKLGANFTGDTGFSGFTIDTSNVNGFSGSEYGKLSVTKTNVSINAVEFAAFYLSTALVTPITVWITQIQCEDITGSAYQLPSEYIKTTTAAKSKWFTTKPDGSPIYPAPKLLMEGQSQNVCLQSQAFSTSPWSVVGDATFPTTNNLSPNGSADAYELLQTSGRVEQNCNTLTDNTVYTFSFYAKAKTGSATITPTVKTKANTLIQSNNVITAAYTRVYITGDIGSGATTPAISIRGNGNFIIWGAQLEASPVPTSYMPTVASPMTRTADACSWTLSAELQTMLAAEGTIVLDWTPGFIPPVAQIGIVSCADAVDSLLSVAAGGSVTRSTDGTTPISGGATLTSNTQRKLILRWSAASGKYQISSIASGVVTHGTSGSFDGAFTLGSNLLLHYSNAYPAKYSGLKLFKRYLTDSELMRLQ